EQGLRSSTSHDRILLEKISQGLLEALRRPKEQRLHRTLRAPEGLRDVAVREPVEPRQEQRRTLLRRQRRDRDLEPTGELPARRSLLRRDRGGIGQLRPFAALLGVASLEQVDPQVALGSPELCQAEVVRD